MRSIQMKFRYTGKVLILLLGLILTQKSYAQITPPGNKFPHNIDCCKGTAFGGFTITDGRQYIKVKCGQKNIINLSCNVKYSISAETFTGCSDMRRCRENVVYILQTPSASYSALPTSSPFTPTENGLYTLRVIGKCGEKECKECIIQFRVSDCKEDHTNCCPGKWGLVTFNPGKGYSERHTKIYTCGSNTRGESHNVNCNTDYFINANYECPANCEGKITYSVFPAGASISPAGVFRATQNGNYVITISGECDGQVCERCTFNFQVTGCETSEDCCKNKPVVKKESEVVKHEYIDGIPYALFRSNIQLSGGTVPYQEIKASVVHFKLESNYEQCISCKNKPFTWASIGGGNLAGIPPLTTGATPAMGYNVLANPAENPREIVWSNGSPISLNPPQSIRLDFYLPAVSDISCCEIEAEICIKLTFKDIDCVVCEEIVCYKVLLNSDSKRKVK